MLNLRLPIPRILSASEVLGGAGSIKALATLPASRIWVLASRSLLESSDLESRLERMLRQQVWHLEQGISGEPGRESIEPYLESLNEFRPDWIVAIGGGSILDGAKASWVFHECKGVDEERIYRPFGIPRLRGKCRFVAVPTTPGTGSEVSSSALLCKPGGGKEALVSHELLPDLAILDPELMRSLPKKAFTGAVLDTLAHVLEAYVSRYENALADGFAEGALRQVSQYFARAVEHPDAMQDRLALQQAAMMGGWLQNLKVPGVAHCLAHQLEPFGVPHGLGCGLLLPAAMRANRAASEVVERKYGEMEQRLGDVAPNGLGSFVESVFKGSALSASLQDHLDKPFGTDVVEKIAEAATRDLCAKANPVELDAEFCQSVLEDALA